MATSTFTQVNSELADFLASSSFSGWERCNSLIFWRVHYLLHLKMNSVIFWRVHRPLAGKSWTRQIIDFGQFNRSQIFISGDFDTGDHFCITRISRDFHFGISCDFFRWMVFAIKRQYLKAKTSNFELVYSSFEWRSRYSRLSASESSGKMCFWRPLWRKLHQLRLWAFQWKRRSLLVRMYW